MPREKRQGMAVKSLKKGCAAMEGKDRAWKKAQLRGELNAKARGESPSTPAECDESRCEPFHQEVYDQPGRHLMCMGNISHRQEEKARQGPSL